MGIRLITEVLDHAPADLTPAERLVLVVIAEAADDTTREGWPGMGTLERRVGMSADGVRRALQRLARRGLDVRVALGKDAQGRPVYSARGRRTTYRIPRLKTDGMAVPRSRYEPSGAGTTVPPLGGNGGTPVPPITQKGGTTVPPIAKNGGTTVPAFGVNGGTAVPPSRGNGGTLVPQWRDAGPTMAGPQSRPSPYEPSLNPHPPYPPTARNHVAAALAEIQKGEGEEENGEDEKTTHLVGRIRSIRPDWSSHSIRRVLQDDNVRERPWPVVEAALTALARDPETTAPGRLRADGPWWTEAANATRPKPDLLPLCGQCDNRWINTDKGLVRCPRCHPLARRTA